MWSDANTTIDEMRADVGRFIEEREWNRYHHPVNVASAMAVEAGELLELFQWRRPGDPVPEDIVRAAGSEMADTLHFALCLANAIDTEVDIGPLTVGDLVEGQADAVGGAKGAAEEALSNAALALIAARSRYGPGGSGPEPEGDGALDAVLVAVEMTITSLARCAKEMGLDLSRELELKNELNEERFPIGSRPDVGY
jgi:NTP pyrophosphatase (non-canonical NTP hydrolase)